MVAVNHLMYSLSPYYVEIWLIVGVFFIIVEVLHLPNIGFLFLGLGALSCGILISTFLNLTIYQWVVFGLSSAGWCRRGCAAQCGAQRAAHSGYQETEPSGIP